MNKFLAKLFPSKSKKNQQDEALLPYKQVFQDKIGLEIGGPSQIFTDQTFPLYEWAQKIDGCNFSNNTIWEGAINTDEYRYLPNKSGHQYILEGSELKGIEDNEYDFLLSSHNLEHIANPLKAVKEWIRILKPGGYMLLILPDKRFTFDHKRPDTSFAHLLSDLELNTGEDDLTHLSEILELHDLSLDHGAGDYESFKKRSENNFEVRGLHQHVFSQALLKECLEYFDLKVQLQHFVAPYHQIIIAQK
ncbi:methyltransferase domain-containing protein [Mucilaginibacter sp. SP1R1]|uniref:methyltransferase domain-containing protein n=1 Tax=Mucilaginibacter sp. SP1R1 TaxID=2723091 RepID=UPI00160BBFF7|nr:class I SAM-dependent methyltransferase [Mucilaginibacter sp. SP1R1]MBB6150917.1 SAM-dependent methyltransferase [Mucilaginibacter sp. SP1R1]